MTYTPQPSIAWEEVEQALVDWATEMTGLETVWAEENAPQPERPYITLDWLSLPAPIGDDYWSTEADEETKEIDRVMEGVRRATITVGVHAAETRPGRNANYFADLLVNSLHSDTVAARFFAPYRMAPWGTQAILKGQFAEEGHAVSRASFDMTMGFAAGTGLPSERVGYITGASITATLSSPSMTDSIAVTS